jgi:membrane-bound inhibitor of C-type lysozyme
MSRSSVLVFGAFVWVALLTGACSHGKAPPANPASVEGDEELKVRDAFTCESGENLATEFDTEQRRIALSLNGGSLVRLPEVPAASGSKFSDGHVTFWSHGDDAVLETKDSRMECHRVLSR